MKLRPLESKRLLLDLNQKLSQLNQRRVGLNRTPDRLKQSQFESKKKLNESTERRNESKKRKFETKQRKSRHKHRSHMQPNKSVHRSQAILKLPNVVAALIAYAQAIITAMTSNPRFPSPVPGLALVTAAIAALQSAQSSALARTKGAVTARNDKKAALVALLQQLRMYVQTVADADLENSAAIIQSAGIAVKKAPLRKPRVFDAVQGAVSGTVKLVTTSAAKSASYDWEYSSDGGKTWIPLPSTLQAKTSITGLAQGSTVQVRYRSVTKAGVADWSQPMSLFLK